MPSTNDSKTAARNGAPTRAGQEALIARARELIADPDYPTEAIVEELAELLMHHAADPAGS
jgi:hypothetical protein